MRQLLLAFTTAASFVINAQTPIDQLQKNNLKFLESKEGEGFEFRSQIITEFDAENASQNVNIKLSEQYTYIIGALGDANVPQVNLSINPSNKAQIEAHSTDENLIGQAFLLTPNKSGKFKISINAEGLGEVDKGFISFMVLRKE